MPIVLTPEVLRGQAGQMQSLMNEYDSLFNSVTSTLNQVNSNWSANLAHNFSSKISSAQRSFSTILDTLGYGVNASNASANSFQDIDSQLAKVLGGLGLTGAKQNSSSAVLLSSAGQKTSMKIDLPETGDKKETRKYAGKTIKNFWDSQVDKYRHIESKAYIFSSNSGHESGSIMDGISYTHSTDVRTLYGKTEEGVLLSTASVGYKQSLHQFDVYSGLKSNPDAKVNLVTYDLHAAANFDPMKGNMFVSAGAGIDLVSATIGDENVSISPKIGYGAHFTCGVSGGKLSLNAGAAYKIGMDININFDYESYWKAVKEAFKHPIL